MKRALLLVGSVIMAGGLFAGAEAQQDFKPVTDAMLQNPDASEWPGWRRTQDSQGYSPLNQITKDNAGRLQLAWSWALNAGASEPAPIVHDGVMYIPSPGGGVTALDATNGDFLWEYRKQHDQPELYQRPMRSLALFGDKVFATTTDAHIVALNARTGAVVWDKTTADHKLGYEYTSGPIAAKGHIIAGITGCGRYKNDVCFISAYDPDTGRELWRTSTVARPGEPGGDTWGDLPLVYRAGSDAWIPGSYDPAANLIYWSTAQAKPWARAVRGTDGDALYTNSTLALDPDTGKITWYYQYLPGETQDMDEVFESVLVDHDGKSSLFKMGKLGILWELDRKTGKFVAAHDLGYQNIVDLDGRTGKTTYRPGMIPQIGVELTFCPSTAGFKDWRAMAYLPQTRAFYIPIALTCEKAVFEEVPRAVGGGGTGPVKRTNMFHPTSPEGLGEFVAMDVNGKVLWRYRTRTPMNTAALTTAGGLAIAGDWDRNLYVFDAANGKVLYQTRMPTSVQGFPISYAVKGKQYIAVPVGSGGGSWSSQIPGQLTPDRQNRDNANAIYVFALPER
ncbi:MAG TPA: PQQ-binding-like beta-propeller repeat protein [Micropepsaceae bacterium]|nr:PQQ-binding-like beta-propeller repeat protein [Micropepsaceae bacterium]